MRPLDPDGGLFNRRTAHVLFTGSLMMYLFMCGGGKYLYNT
jgi:hypothetical protein